MANTQQELASRVQSPLYLLLYLNIYKVTNIWNSVFLLATIDTVIRQNDSKCRCFVRDHSQHSKADQLWDMFALLNTVLDRELVELEFLSTKWSLV